MSYEAIICRLSNVRKHSNADRLNVGSCLGYQVIVGLNNKDGDLGVFFREGGQLCENMCFENNLYNKKELNKNQNASPGIFTDKRRIKAVKLRGEISEGFWIPLESLSWAGNISFLKENFSFDTFNGHKICQKYFTPATVDSISKPEKKKLSKFKRWWNKNFKFYKFSEVKKEKYDFSMLKEHYDTKQVRDHIHRIPEGSILYFTCKSHGTSQRTGNIKVKKRFFGFRKWWNKKFKFIKFNDDRWLIVSGTRRTIMKPPELVKGNYDTEDFRNKHHKKIKSCEPLKGECIYYELVGFTNNFRPIMPPHGVDDKELSKKYGSQMVYRYGCADGESKILVYRITHTNEDGDQYELSWPQVVSRCKKLGLQTVPLLAGPIVYDGNREKLLEILKKLSDGPDPLDKDHIREGVVLRVEHENLFECFKYKGFSFCLLEGLRANDDGFIDEEDIS